MNFDIALTESRLKDPASQIKVELENYSIEHTPTEVAAGAALVYINKMVSHHTINDLNIYMPGKLESIFIGMAYPKSSIIIVRCIYKHLSQQLNKFTNDIIVSLLEKLNKKIQRKLFFLVILT